MRSISRFAAFTASVALVASSTAAAAAAPAPAAAQVPSPWIMLTSLSGTQAVALGGATTAAQPTDVPPPGPPPPPPVVAAPGPPVITGEVIGILVWFALIALALTHSGSSGAPNSPA